MPANRVSAGIITASNSTFGIVDGSTSTRTVAFDGTESGYGNGIIAKVTASIFFGKASGIAFPTGGVPRYNQMAFRLTNPSGTTTVNLINAGDFSDGISGFAYLGTMTFDDDAALVVNFLPIQPVFGTYRPTESTPNNFMANFDGESALGTWTLTIVDTMSGASIRFFDFTLTIETLPAPEPATLALAGGGIITLAGYGWRRRRRARAAA